MDESQLAIRPFTEADYEAYSEVRTAARPNHPVSAETLRHWDAALGTDRVRNEYVVEVRGTGRIVAIGDLGEDPAYPKRYWVQLYVRPEYQRRGIGTRLFEDLLRDARRRDGVCLRASVQTEEAAGLAFTARRGFRERNRDWQSVLEVDAVDTSSLPGLRQAARDAGIEVTTLARDGATDPAVAQRLYDLGLATEPDAPRMDPYVPWTFDQFRRAELEGSQFLPEAWFLAKVGEEYVAGSWAQREAADPGLLQQDWTGTRSAYRRRGLARVLKLSLIDYAQRNGFHRIRTNNNSLNAPMWQLNEELGFRRISTTIQLEMPLV